MKKKICIISILFIACIIIGSVFFVSGEQKTKWRTFESIVKDCELFFTESGNGLDYLLVSFSNGDSYKIRPQKYGYIGIEEGDHVIVELYQKSGDYFWKIESWVYLGGNCGCL